MSGSTSVWACKRCTQFGHVSGAHSNIHGIVQRANHTINFKCLPFKRRIMNRWCAPVLYIGQHCVYLCLRALLPFPMFPCQYPPIHFALGSHQPHIVTTLSLPQRQRADPECARWSARSQGGPRQRGVERQRVACGECRQVVASFRMLGMVFSLN